MATFLILPPPADTVATLVQKSGSRRSATSSSPSHRSSHSSSSVTTADESLEESSLLMLTDTEDFAMLIEEQEQEPELQPEAAEDQKHVLVPHQLGGLYDLDTGTGTIEGQPHVASPFFLNNTNEGSELSEQGKQKAGATTDGVRSILNRCGMEIPISNKGWKSNLPRPDLSKIQNPATASTDSDRRKMTSSRMDHSSYYQQQRKKVQFTTVLVRTYDQCVGDNPSVSYGTPVQLDWHYEQYTPIALDAFEASRSGLRRSPRRLAMNCYQRRNLLLHRFGCTEPELVAAERAANKIKTQRHVTQALLPMAAVMERITWVSSAARKTQRVLRKTRRRNNKQQ